MGIFGTKEKSPLYHVRTDVWPISEAPDADLEKWANDPNCIERDQCARVIEQRANRRATKRAAMQENPFDPRTEISADARHIADRIVTTMWIILVLLPVVLGILYELLK